MTPTQQEAVDAMREYGSQKKAAAALGISRSSLQERLMRAKRCDPAIAGAMEAIGTGLMPSLAWVKTKPTDDAPGYSVMLRPPELPDDTLDRIRAAFEDMAPAPMVQPPESVMADLCTLYPLFDVHLGLHAWGRETGAQDYDLKHALTDIGAAFAKVMALTPPSAQAILLIGGDFFHADDNRAETPANHHKLDTDGRHYKVLDRGVGIIAETITALLSKHESLTIRVMRGNHDEHSHMVLTFAIAERFRDNPRVDVQKDPRDLFMFQWGKAAIFAHHGDKAKPQQMALYLSDVCAFWSATRHRHFFSGHVHHDQAKDLGPLRWESLRAFCPPDAYAASMGYGARRAMQSITFDKRDGLVLRALDPIERVE